MDDLAWPVASELLLSMAVKKRSDPPLGAAAARPSTTNRRFAKLRMIRDQVAALWSIFAFFGVPSGKTVFCPSWITYSSLVILDFAGDDRRGGCWIARF